MKRHLAVLARRGKQLNEFECFRVVRIGPTSRGRVQNSGGFWHRTSYFFGRIAPCTRLWMALLYCLHQGLLAAVMPLLSRKQAQRICPHEPVPVDREIRQRWTRNVRRRRGHRANPARKDKKTAPRANIAERQEHGKELDELAENRAPEGGDAKGKQVEAELVGKCQTSAEPSKTPAAKR